MPIKHGHEKRGKKREALPPHNSLTIYLTHEADLPRIFIKMWFIIMSHQLFRNLSKAAVRHAQA